MRVQVLIPRKRILEKGKTVSNVIAAGSVQSRTKKPMIIAILGVGLVLGGAGVAAGVTHHDSAKPSPSIFVDSDASGPSHSGRGH